MILHENDLRVTVTANARGGQGEFVNVHLLEAEDFQGAGRLYAKCLLKPGHSVGSHVHLGEMEIIHFLSGQGTVISDGVSAEVGPGDSNLVREGHQHEIINSGSEDLVFMALILYCTKKD